MLRFVLGICACSLAAFGCDSNSDDGHGNDEHGHESGELSEACNAIMEACHTKDPGEAGNPISECHGAAHDNNVEYCEMNRADCVAKCDAAPTIGATTSGGEGSTGSTGGSSSSHG
jgi:hypothetical protein